MDNIILICAAGMSTSMLVKRMEAVAKEHNKDVKITAFPQHELTNYVGDIDCILLGPQIGYLEEEVKREYEPKGIPVEVINSSDYGMLDGKKVLKRALKMIKESKES
ncbi:MAG: PTS sugar transporter subunit IIB [Clostridiales bacterium]|jgi:PTS system cellobiose-specific IIB component|nr:PTS sugar transporter subunit IIB [Clostridiales bacterium]